MGCFISLSSLSLAVLFLLRYKFVLFYLPILRGKNVLFYVGVCFFNHALRRVISI
uniref:Uncharacterized protein n=1 Tax=Anguilla anguilla TaxID=7936 RepID=A0A0E9V2Q7_ANGAN